MYSYALSDGINLVDPTGLVWEYSQSTGKLTHIDDKTGTRTRVGTGYSGAGEGKNNPKREWQSFVGPIPSGDWTVEPTSRPQFGSPVLSLTPTRWEDAYYRNQFLIHGDSRAHPGQASEGCIILPKGVRERMRNSGDRNLRVVP